jgi:NhaP-type Na+/H+ or K+/H+ antiporter
VLDESPEESAAATILGTVAVTVLLSILLHGLTARPIATAYGPWAGRQPQPTEAHEVG